MDLRWVHRWKGQVKSRLCVRGFKQQVSDLDDTYASTPIIWILFVLLTMALARNWTIHFCDVSTAFLHAALSSEDPIYVWPPKEFYAFGTTLWLLKRAMYGLRTSPKDWQLHFASTMTAMNFTRLQSDPDVCVYVARQVAGIR